MTEKDFFGWCKAHFTAFPSVEQGMEYAVSKENATISVNDILKSWREVLRYVPLDAALEATRQLQAGTEERPKLWEDHPAAVRRIANKLGRKMQSKRYYDGTEAIDCLLCGDSGYVTVWHTVSMAQMESVVTGHLPKFEGPKASYSASTLCTCQRGQRIQANGQSVYDPDVWCRMQYGPRYQDDIERLRAFMANRVKARMF